MLAPAQLTLTGSAMLRRAVAPILLLVCALIVTVGDAGRPAPSYAAVTLKPGDIVVGTLDNILTVDPTTGASSVLTADPHFDFPVAHAVGPNGEVYVADTYFKVNDTTSRPTVARVDPQTGAPAVITSGGFGLMTGLAVQADGKLILTDTDNQRIVRIDPANGARSTVTSGGQLISASDAAIERDGSILTTALVANGEYEGPRQVLRIRATDSAQEVVSTGGLLARPYFVATSPDGSIFISDVRSRTSQPRIIRIDPRSGAQFLVSQFDNGWVSGIAVDPTGMVLVAGFDNQFNSGVFRINPLTGQRTVVNQPPHISGSGSLALVPGPSPVCPGPLRPPVSVRSTRLGNGRLQVNVRATGSANSILRIQPGTHPNAVVESQPTIAGPDATFVVRRTAPGPVTLPFTVTDACGDWKTFVGGGAGAF